MNRAVSDFDEGVQDRRVYYRGYTQYESFGCLIKSDTLLDDDSCDSHGMRYDWLAITCLNPCRLPRTSQHIDYGPTITNGQI